VTLVIKQQCLFKSHWFGAGYKTTVHIIQISLAMILGESAAAVARNSNFIGQSAGNVLQQMLWVKFLWASMLVMGSKC
jgi:hypothetical protein